MLKVTEHDDDLPVAPPKIQVTGFSNPLGLIKKLDRDDVEPDFQFFKLKECNNYEISESDEVSSVTSDNLKELSGIFILNYF